MDERTTNDREFDALVHCASVCTGAHEPARHSLHNIDWNRLLELAMRHKIMPLLYDGLAKLHSESVPEDFANFTSGISQTPCAMNSLLRN